MGQLATLHIPEVYLLLSTGGGQVREGIALYNTLKAMPFKLITHNVSSVDSIGNAVFLAGQPRYAVPHSTFMFHGVGSTARADTRLEEKLLRERLDAIVADQLRIGAVIADRTNLKAKDVEGLFREAQTKDTAYAISHGIIDEVREVNLPDGVPLITLTFQRQSG